MRKMPTNREYMIALLLDGAEDKELTLKNALALDIDDGGAAAEAMVNYNIGCPYCNEKDCRLGKYEDPNWDTCVRCKTDWLDKEVEE